MTRRWSSSRFLSTPHGRRQQRLPAQGSAIWPGKSCHVFTHTSRTARAVSTEGQVPPPGRGLPCVFGQVSLFWDGVRGRPRDPPSGCKRRRTYGGQRRRGECHSAAFAQVRGYVM